MAELHTADVAFIILHYYIESGAYRYMYGPIKITELVFHFRLGPTPNEFFNTNNFYINTFDTKNFIVSNYVCRDSRVTCVGGQIFRISRILDVSTHP